jgi:hypothetical protein
METNALQVTENEKNWEEVRLKYHFAGVCAWYMFEK